MRNCQKAIEDDGCQLCTRQGFKDYEKNGKLIVMVLILSECHACGN